MDTAPTHELLHHAPAELTASRLRRLGEGVGSVVYASEHWVVRRERSPFEIVALIVVWKLLRKLERLVPGALGKRLVRRPSGQIRFLRVIAQATLAVVPKSIWFSTHVREMWREYHFRRLRGDRVARARLAGTGILPATVDFPPIRVAVAGWPGWLTVSEAAERVEATLHQRISELARAGRFDLVELWLWRFLDLRQSGWKLGVFSVDAHLKNFGVAGDRIVLIDTGGLTNRWHDVEKRLVFEEVTAQPHIQLGLGPALGGTPELAARFDAAWKAIVNRDQVRRHWTTAAG